MLHTLDARAARRWAVAALVALGAQREEIDSLNVFPVPDGDTGTNLYLTFEAACTSASLVGPDAALGAVAEAFARGALLGARGNSGVIVAQLIRGWVDVLTERGPLDAAALIAAAERADQQAWRAVSTPVEGTILSVSRACAAAAAAVGDPAATGHGATGLGQVVVAMVEAGRRALASTTGQLEVLHRAGVVDAGGRGYLVLIEALDDVVAERTPAPGRAARLDRTHRRERLPLLDRAPADHRPPDHGPADHGPADHGPADHALPDHGSGGVVGGPDYEVMFLLDADVPAVDRLRSDLATAGDSLVVTGGDALWAVHVHVDDPGAAVEAGIRAGRPHQVRITHLGRQRQPVGLVACAAGPGLAAAFAQAGAVVVRIEPGRRTTTGLILDGVRRARSGAVVVLPNDDQTLEIARAAAGLAREEGIRVTVLPTRAQVQGLAAAAVHDPSRRADDDLVRMSAAAGAARDGAVTLAARDGATPAGPCRAGDPLGVVQGAVAIVGHDLRAVAVCVLDRLLVGGGELVTVVRGADADDALIDHVLVHLSGRRGELDVVLLDGGQARYPLLLGVE